MFNKRFQRHSWKSVSQWIDNNDAFLQLKISIRKNITYENIMQENQISHVS